METDRHLGFIRTLYFLLLVIFVCVVFLSVPIMTDYKVVYPFSPHITRGIAGSGSMQPFINKDVYPLVRTTSKHIADDENLWEGRIYIYRNDNKNGSYKLVFHRLVGIYNLSEYDDEILYVFMGDNNLVVDDPVYRNQIIEEITGVNLE